MAYGFDLGAGTRPVTTDSKEAQLWFDRGLTWCYGFHHEEAVACFERAAAADSGCAMAQWGIAYALGPNYNKPWDAFDETEAAAAVLRAHHAARRAAHLAEGCSQAETGLIDALLKRYPKTAMDESWQDWDRAYADAMRGVHESNPGDADVEALFAEALMILTPWAMWDLSDGSIPEGACTLEAKAVLENALTRIESGGGAEHPGLLHQYIHLMEMSQYPERALNACDRLRGLVPSAGHLQHMPTHIDVLCGDYARVINDNEAAIRADRQFLEYGGALNFYTLYRCHDYHFKVYGAMFLGRSRDALETADEMNATLTEDLLRIESPPMADWLEGFVPVRQHVLVRFGMWDEILRQPFPDDQQLFCVTAATMRYARAVAAAATGRVKQAEVEADGFEGIVNLIYLEACRSVEP